MTTVNEGSAQDLIRKIRSLPAKRQRALRALLEQQGVDLSALDVIPRAARTADEPVLLSYAQQRLWFLAQLDGTSAYYNIPMALRLRGPLDRPALHRALEEIVRRHEVLRTRFVDHDGVPHQHIGDGADFRVPFEEAADDARLRSVCEQEAVTPFDLERDCLIRVRLLRRAEREHVLMVTMHHSVSDGWSLGVFLADLVALYEAYAEGRPSPLEPLPVQYADYAEWQRQWLDDEVQERQIGYWTQRLDGVDARLTFPADRPRPRTKTYHGAHERFSCPPDLMRRLQELSERHDVTLYMTLLAVYLIALHRYTGHTDLAVGTPVAGRNRLETESLIGFFANTLVMRNDLAGDPTFAELLARVRKTALEAYDHQDVPFEAVVDALRPERSLSHSPVFQTMFVLQERQTQRDVRLGELEVSLVEFDFDITKFDVTLDLRETPDGLIGAVEYNTSLFERATVQRFVGHYTQLLAAVADGPGERISRLGMLDAAERHQVLEAWNDTRRPYSDDRCLHELVEQAVARHPERTAVVFGDRAWSYRELDTRADRVADALRRHGVGPDTVVGLYMERSAELVAAVLGVLKAGGAYLPLEPTHPADRTAYVVDSSGVEVVLTQPQLSGRPPAGVRRLLTLDTDGRISGPDLSGPDGESPVAEPAAAGPRDLAYVIYTSGSTGRPKGVMVEHRAVVNRIEWMQNEYRLGPDDVVLQKTPFTFDVSVWEFFWPLIAGARLVVAEPEGHKDPDYLVSLIRETGVTTLHFVPSMLRSVVDEADWAACTSVRQVFCSGEALPADLCTRHYARHRAPLHNLYGPTEAAIDVSHWTCPDDRPLHTVPIGRPIQNIQLHVLNEALEPQGVGCVGQLYIAGDGLARGYLGNPDLTRERFLPNPFADEPGARMYQTGDLVRRLADGTLEFLGRADDQVKLRGFRIELGEIEHRLAQHPAVRSCAVVVREDQPGNQQLVAYAVAEGPEAADRDALVAHLERTLPQYMVPSAFVTLETLPVTANGKLDRKALPAPGIDAYDRNAYVAPRPGTEQLLAEAWAELLGFDQARIGAQDNFFALGGHSLLITVLIARLKAHGLTVTVRAVFNAPTLARLAEEIDAAGTGTAFTVPPNRIPQRCARITPDLLPLIDLTQEQIDAVVATVPGGAPNVQDIYPLVPSQEGILFHHLIDPDNDPYVIPILLAAEDEEAVTRFVAALQSLVDRHDVMRTAVLTAGLPEPVQVVHREARLPVRRHTLDPAADAESQARALLEHPGRMTLATAPLLDLLIAEDPHSARRFLRLSAHHLIEDATSLRLILEELVTHMSGRLERLAPPAPYRDFVAHTLHQLAAGEAETFFRDRLADVTEPTTPFGLTDVRGDGRGVRELRRSLPPGLTRDLRAEAQRLRTSPATLFHAAWSVVVAVCSGRDDVVFGTVLSGRLQGVPGVERMLGNFINTLPLRVRLAGRSVGELVSDIDTALKELIVHEQTSLILAQRSSGLDGDVPLFSSMLNFRHFEPGQDDTGMPGAEAQGVRWLASVDRTNYPVGVSVDDTGAELSLNAQADASISVEAVIDYVEAAVSAIVSALATDDGAGTPALSVDILPAPERRRLLTEWNDTDRPYPHESCLADLFEEQVRLRPDAVAVEHGTRTLTYAEVNARANRVAHYLRAQGVGPDTLVGLCAERSPETVTGLLGILKAGGAYVPIDPGYPEERVRTIVRDSGARIVLSQSHVPAALLDGAGQVVHLDTGELAGDGTQVLAGRPGTDPSRAEVGTTPGHLAYVIFTSGSTGRPKGVLVEQRGVVRLVRNPDYFPADERTVVLHHSSISFDVGSQEVLGPLLNGARLVLHDGDSKDVVQLLDRIERSGVTMLALSAAFLPAFTEASLHRRLPLTYLGVGGEAFSAKDVRALYAAHPGLTVVNAYGPTENSIASTCQVIPRDLAEDAVIPIGRPIAQSTAHVTDDRLRLVPCGVVGELCVGGAGVARGYLDNPELTAERFVPDPFDPAPGARLYRTGDLVRRLPDGTLEFVGRVDDQVKVRGFRIELGEIESALHSHPAVHSAVVTTQVHGDGGKLIAYVRPTDAWLDSAAEEQNAEQLQQWQRLFEDQYAEAADGAADAPDAELNLVGWNSSYTGEPIPEPEMREWIDGTVGLIRELRPERLLEIGCGTGLLLYRYAGACEAVHAVDISASALAGVRRGAERRGWSHVTLAQGDALSVTAPEGLRFDTVVLNSVVQYFPNRQYLQEAIARILPLVEDGGRILVGDVRNLDLFSAHAGAVERSRTPVRQSAAALAEQVRRRRRQDGELLVSPTFFAGLRERFPDIGAVDLRVKRGLGENEMIAYRYDVVLTKGEAAPDGPSTWLEAGTPAALRALLDDGAPERFGVVGLANPRIADDVAVAEGLARWSAAHQVEPLPAGARLSATAAAAVRELEEALRYAESLGYRVAATWSQDRPDGLDLVLGRGELPPVRARAPYRRSHLANTPQVGRTGQALARVLKEHLAAKVPDYMVPSVFVALEELPVTPNGKVDKKALPAPDETDVTTEAYVAPRTGTERDLCRLVADVLGLSRVGLQDGFFDLGGHSLLATRLTIRVKQETGRDLPLHLILGGATVAEMAAALDEQEQRPATGPAQAPVPLPRGGTAPEAPLSLQQRELWFLNPGEHLGSAYDNVQMAYRIVGRLDRRAYARAFELLVERHAVLRTSYHTDGGTPVQRVNDDSGFAVVVEQVDGDAAVAELLRAERARPFFPADRCMLRVHLLALSEHEHVAVVTRPWGIFDGWSTGTLLAELNAAYTALAGGDEPELPELPLRYADFARWQHEAVGPAELDRQTDYWRRQLAGLPACVSLRTDYRRPPVTSHQGSTVEVTVPAELLAQLQRYSQERGVTLYMTLLSAFGVLLGMYTEDRELAIGSPVTNRPHPDLERLVGYFVNVLVMRLDVAPARTFEELLEQTKRVTAEAHAHKDVPFAALAEALAQDPDPACSPLFQVMFNLIPAPAPAPRDGTAPDLATLPVRSGDGPAKSDLNLVLRETPTGLHGHLEYSSDLFARRTARTMAALYERLLLKILTSPAADLAALRAAARGTEF
ncbi:amino acid adenylation domain-containing protein [Streptomyces cinerochromogenes]|uniref:amino acid adenylation domain-containing protein n=1 Tax=Streptomyces cinerochromogenes TaxID=66422 RepID=UPI0033B34E8F